MIELSLYHEIILSVNFATYYKSFERKCFVCVEVRECETNAYNCGGLGRCEKDSASENIQRARNIHINDESSKYNKSAHPPSLLKSMMLGFSTVVPCSVVLFYP